MTAEALSSAGRKVRVFLTCWRGEITSQARSCAVLARSLVEINPARETSDEQ